jgi:catechol-2,3-dioxygenase
MNKKNKNDKVEHLYTGIVVVDLKKQLEFYRDLIGLEVYYSHVEKGAFLNKILGEAGHRPLIYQLGSRGKNIIALLYFSDAKKSKTKKLINTGLTHIALIVKKLDDLYLLLMSKGIKFAHAPEISPDGRHKVSFCRDFDGNYVELVEALSEDEIRNNARPTKSAGKKRSTRVSK